MIILTLINGCNQTLLKEAPIADLSQNSAFLSLQAFLRQEGKSHIAEDGYLSYIILNSNLFQKFILERFKE